MRKFFSVLFSIVFFLLSGVALAWVSASLFRIIFLQGFNYKLTFPSFDSLVGLYLIYIALAIIFLIGWITYKKVEKKIAYSSIISLCFSISAFVYLWVQLSYLNNSPLTESLTDIQLSYIYDHFPAVGALLFIFFIMLFLGYKVHKKTFFCIATLLWLSVVFSFMFVESSQNMFSGEIGMGITENYLSMNITYIGILVSLIVWFLGYKVLKKKFFLITLSIWFVVLGGCLVYYAQPIKGLEDVSDSVFALPEEVASFTATISSEKCEKLAELGIELDKNSFLPPNFTNLRNNIPLIAPLIDYNQTIEDLNRNSYFEKIKLINPDIRKRILSGDFLEQDMRKFYTPEIILQDTKSQEKFLKSQKEWLEIKKKQPEMMIQILSSLYPENGKKIKELITTIEDINKETGMCREDKGPLDTLYINKTSPYKNPTQIIRAVRILNQYAFILVESGNYEETLSVLNTLIQYIDHTARNDVYSVMGGMVLTAIQNMTYSNINIIATYLPITSQIDLADGIASIIPMTETMKNMYRGEYISNFYLPETEIQDNDEVTYRDVSVMELGVSLLFDPREAELLNRNCYATLLYEIDPTLETGKYSCEDVIELVKKQPGFYNIFGRRGMFESAESYQRRFFYTEMQKNTLLQKLRGQDSTNPTTPDNSTSPCQAAGGQWLAEFKECLGIDAATCEKIGGKFNDCASACRNDPKAEICTMQCVQVCEVK